MKKRPALLSEAQWTLLAPLFPDPGRRRDGQGRPWASNRACLEGIVWVLRTGARWRDLPEEYPDGSWEPRSSVSALAIIAVFQLL